MARAIAEARRAGANSLWTALMVTRDVILLVPRLFTLLVIITSTFTEFKGSAALVEMTMSLARERLVVIQKPLLPLPCGVAVENPFVVLAHVMRWKDTVDPTVLHPPSLHHHLLLQRD